MKKPMKSIKSFLATVMSGIPIYLVFIFVVLFFNVVLIFLTGDYYDERFSKIEDRLTVIEQRVNDAYAVIGDDAAFQDDVYQNFLFLNQKIDKILLAEAKSPQSKKNPPCHR
jgi:hypothetical protein